MNALLKLVKSLKGGNPVLTAVSLTVAAGEIIWEIYKHISESKK